MFLEILAGSSFSGNEQCEFLERIDTADPRKWLSTVCAYANSEGGLLFVGAKDNRITGFDRSSKIGAPICFFRKLERFSLCLKHRRLHFVAFIKLFVKYT